MNEICKPAAFKIPATPSHYGVKPREREVPGPKTSRKSKQNIRSKNKSSIAKDLVCIDRKP